MIRCKMMMMKVMTKTITHSMFTFYNDMKVVYSRILISSSTGSSKSFNIIIVVINMRITLKVMYSRILMSSSAGSSTSAS